MRMAGKVFAMVLLLCVMAAVGCQKRIELTFVNHTDTPHEVKVTTPERGTATVGSVGADGGQLHHTIRINNDDLPAQCSVRVGLLSKTFEVNQDMKDKQWFHRDDKGLAGPMDKKAVYTTKKVIQEIRTSGGTTTVID